MLLEELLEDKKPTKKQKIVFVESNPQNFFPQQVVTYLKSQIKKDAKDLERTWKSAQELVDNAFQELKVPKPEAFLRKRWFQYTELLKHAVKELGNARGYDGDWINTIT